MQQTAITAKRLTEVENESFNRVMNNMMNTGGATLIEFKDSSNPSNRRYDILDKCFVRTNNSCSKPVEPLYYSCNYPECRTVVTIPNAVPILD